MSGLPEFKGQTYKVRNKGKLNLFTDEFSNFLDEAIRNNLTIAPVEIARFYDISIEIACKRLQKVLDNRLIGFKDQTIKNYGDCYSYLKPRKETTYNEVDSLSSPFYNNAELTGEELHIFKNL